MRARPPFLLPRHGEVRDAQTFGRLLGPAVKPWDIILYPTLRHGTDRGVQFVAITGSHGQAVGRHLVFCLILAMILGAPVAAQDGDALYQHHCAVCHQANGDGVPFFQPSLIGSAVAVGDASLAAWFVLQGSAAWGPGESDYENEMPGFEHLSDAELAAILTYVRTSWGNEADALGPAAVAEQRAVIAAERADSP